MKARVEYYSEFLMSAIIIKGKREELFREIAEVLNKWPEFERRIFAQAHYHGQNPESISRSLKIDENEVRTILKDCERKLHTSLKYFRENRDVQPSVASSVPRIP